MLTAEDVTDAVGTAPQPVAPYPPRPARLELLCGGHAHRQVAAALVGHAVLRRPLADVENKQTAAPVGKGLRPRRIRQE